MKKFELTGEFVTNISGIKLSRIRALIAFGSIEVGEKGGFVEKEENLSQDGDARVSGDAEVSSDADYATVKGFGRYNRNTTFSAARMEKSALRAAVSLAIWRSSALLSRKRTVMESWQKSIFPSLI